MELSEIKEEVVYSVDLKVKEENFSSVVYELEVTPKVDIKSEIDDAPRSPLTTIKIKEVQSVVDIKVNLDQDPPADELELEAEPESTNSSNKESKNYSNDNNPQHNPQSSQKRLIRSNRNVLERNKTAMKNQKRELLQCTLCPQSFPRVGLLISHARNEHTTIQNPSSKSISDGDDEMSLQCPLCSRSSTSVRHLRSHFLKFHTKNEPHQCLICLESKNEIKNFSTEYLFKTHMKKVHDPARYKFQCDICSLKFVDYSHYNRHKSTHLEKQFKCEYCSNSFRVKERMLRHIIAVHKEHCDKLETFKCDLCEQLFCSKKDLEGHAVQKHVADTVGCKICFKKFMEEGELSRHLTFAHRENRTWLVCDVCSKVFKTNQDLVQHLEVKHKRFFKCRKCFRSFVSKQEYDSHSTETLDEKVREAKKSQLQCKICFAFLNTECSFTTHQSTHLNPSEFEFKNVSQLNPDDPKDCLMKCDFCPKTFVQKSLLLDHASKCHPNRNFKCKSCEKSFQVKFQLNKHELLHSTKKLFECQVCHKGFPNLKRFKVHENIHKIDKKYKCLQCEKSFVIKQYLRIHTANHHGGLKRFKCVICKKAFASKQFLDRHSLTHTDERPFSCSKCSYSSKRADDLRRHQQSIHSENPISSYRNPVSHPVRLGPHLKYFEHLVFVCCAEDCGFETKDDKEVALHYAKHNLPKVILPRLVQGQSFQVFFSKSAPTNKHMIQARYKCPHCFKALRLPKCLRNHTKIFHDGKKTRRKK